MKHVVFIFLASLFACSDDDSNSASSKGCLTGIPKSGSQNRVLIRCCTNQEYLAGSNTSAGGTSDWDAFKSHKWELCDKCK